jgi:hypothetical protein
LKIAIWPKSPFGLKLANQALLIPLGGALPDKDDHARFLGN